MQCIIRGNHGLDRVALYSQCPNLTYRHSDFFSIKQLAPPEKQE